MCLCYCCCCLLLFVAYYRRGSAELARGHHKKAVRDFRRVVRMKPQDRDARAKLKLCEKIIKEAAFAAAIQSERNLPLSETIDVNIMGAFGVIYTRRERACVFFCAVM